MTCHRCGNPESENIRFFNGLEVRNVLVCKDHKEETIALPWEETSGLIFKHPILGFGFPSINLAPGSNQNINAFQSGLANVPTAESTGAQLQNGFLAGVGALFSGNTPGAYEDVDILCFISGSNVTCINPITNTIVSSGTNASVVLTSGMSVLQSGQVFHINRGLYKLVSGLVIPSAVNIQGTHSPWMGGGTQLQPISGTPAIIMSGGSAGLTYVLNDFFLTHNQPNYNTSLLLLNGYIHNSIISDLNFFDNGNVALSGSAIEMNNAGGSAAASLNIIKDVFVQGFNTVIRVMLSGGANGAFTPYCNSNIFTNMSWTEMGAQCLQLNSTSGTAFDGNIFSNIIIECAQPAGGFKPVPTNTLFDYATNCSGQSIYSKHIGVIANDVTTIGSYATVKGFPNLPATSIEFIGCYGDGQISGASPTSVGIMQHFGLDSVESKNVSQLSSGVGTTSWAFTYDHLGQAQTLTTTPIVTVTPFTSGTASLGSPFVTNVTATGFNYNTPTAAASGLNISITYRATLG